MELIYRTSQIPILFIFLFRFFLKCKQTNYKIITKGYHADKDKLPGYENGIINSYYYVLEDRFDHMQHYYPIKKVFYAREFPTAWRLIDTSVGEPFTISSSS